MKIATIRRNPANSPNMANSDAAILQRVEEMLAAMGHAVQQVSEDDTVAADVQIVCHMSRTNATLQMLHEAEERGCIVLNSTSAIKKCSRLEQMTSLQACGIKQPEFRHITDANELRSVAYPGWIKKSSGWADNSGDVCYTTDSTQATKAFAQIKERGCTSAVYCQHIIGDIVKFYGIEGGFFSFHYPNPDCTKFGLEKINGTPKRHPFNPEELKSTAFKAAAAIGLAIFGGDGIITPQGDIYIIDINDFPSFSAVRETAAEQIAKLAVSKKEIKK